MTRTFALALMTAIAASAIPAQAQQATVPLTLRCFNEAADRQGLDRRVLWGLFATEGGWVGSSIVNTNGSHDLGPMQINDDVWLPTIAKMHFNGDTRQARQAVQYNGCYNAQISAWIFKTYLDKDNGNLPLAVKHYNSHTPEKMENYGNIFAKRFLALWGISVARPTR